MSELRQRLVEELQVRRYALATQPAYVNWVSQLAQYSGKSPEGVSEEEVRRFFVYLTHERKLSRSSVTTALSAVKFLYEAVLRRDWQVYGLVRPRVEKKLPVVLSVAEVQQILNEVRLPHYKVCLSTIYSCGLRLREGTHLQVGDMDSSRMLVHIRNGKGHKDRYVPLPEPTLELLRRFWATHRDPLWLFPGREWAGWTRAQPAPMEDGGVQKAFKAALQASGIAKPATVHTLRHSYRVPPGCHLLEAGVNLRQIQSYLGHESLSTTALYTHLTRNGETVAQETIGRIMAELRW